MQLSTAFSSLLAHLHRITRERIGWKSKWNTRVHQMHQRSSISSRQPLYRSSLLASFFPLSLFPRGFVISRIEFNVHEVNPSVHVYPPLNAEGVNNERRDYMQRKRVKRYFHWVNIPLSVVRETRIPRQRRKTKNEKIWTNLVVKFCRILNFMIFNGLWMFASMSKEKEKDIWKSRISLVDLRGQWFFSRTDVVL